MARETFYHTVNIGDHEENFNENFIEIARKLRRQKPKELDKEMADRDVFLKGIAKMQSQQKLILIWLWQTTQALETFIYKIDHDAAFRSTLKDAELKVREWRRDSANLDNLSEKYKKTLEDVNMSCNARLYRSSGIQWSISIFTVGKPTSSRKASLSRSLSLLINRKLVIRDKNKGTVKLTKLGRDVGEKLTHLVLPLECCSTLE